MEKSLEKLKEGEITLSDYLIEYAMELIQQGATEQEVKQAVESKQYEIDQMYRDIENAARES